MESERRNRHVIVAGPAWYPLIRHKEPAMKRLHKTTFIDRQLSKRVGTFRCEVKKEQLYLKGEAVLLYKTSFAL